MPTGFEFRFENLLSYKTKKEDEAKMHLSEAVQQMEKEKQTLDNLTNQYKEVLNRWNESIREQCRVSEMQLQSTQIKWMAERVEKQQYLLAKAEENTEKCRLLLVEAKKETRKFEKIKEKDYELYQQMEQKMESASMDQFISHRNAQR